MMENIPVVMLHDNLSDLDIYIPAIPGFYFREFQTGDEKLWSALQASTTSISGVVLAHSCTVRQAEPHLK